MSETGVWVLGGYQSDFARNLDREGRDFADLTGEVVDAHARGRGSRPAQDIGVVHVANAFGELFADQGHLGAMPATVHANLWGRPGLTARGGVRVGQHRHPGGAGRSAGRRLPTALVVGMELEKTVPGASRDGDPGRGGLDRSRGPGRRVHVAAHVRAGGRRVRPPLRSRRDPPARYRRAELHQRASQPPRPDPRLGRARSAPTRRRRRQPTRSSRAGSAASTAARSPTAGPASYWSRTTWLRDHPTVAAAGPHPRVGSSHRRPGSGAEAGAFADGSLRAAARARRRTRRVRAAPGRPRRPRRIRDARLLHPE